MLFSDVSTSGGIFFVELDIAFELADRGTYQHFLLALINGRRVQVLRFRREVLAVIGKRSNARALKPLDQHFYSAIRQFQHLQNRRHGPDGEKIVYTRSSVDASFCATSMIFFIMIHGCFKTTD